MCIPQPTEAAAPANVVPSMQSADNLQLGGPNGVPRGAANLGRLQLRLLGNPSGTGTAPATGTPASPPTPTPAATPAATSGFGSGTATASPTRATGGINPGGIANPALGFGVSR